MSYNKRGPSVKRFRLNDNIHLPENPSKRLLATTPEQEIRKRFRQSKSAPRDCRKQQEFDTFINYTVTPTSMKSSKVEPVHQKCRFRTPVSKPRSWYKQRSYESILSLPVNNSAQDSQLVKLGSLSYRPYVRLSGVYRQMSKAETLTRFNTNTLKQIC